MNITVTASGQTSYDNVELLTVTVDGKVIGTVRKDTTTTNKMSGPVKIGETIRKGWSWRIDRDVVRELSVGRYSRASVSVVSSKAKAVADMVAVCVKFGLV